jgi:PAS domain S-box-containing protein
MTLKDVARTSNPSRLDDQIFPQPEGEIPMKAPVVAFGEIVGQSPASRGVLEQTEMVAPSDVTARFVGESGTGKKLLASAIDERSPRGEGPLVRVNCGSIPLNETKKSEAQFRRFIDTVPALLWCNLPDGSNEFLNQRWHEYAGLSPQESHGWGWQVAFHPEDLLKLLEKWQALLVSGEPGEIEARLRRFDGEYRWFLMRAQPVRDQRGDIVKWYGAVTDIEDRAHGSAQLPKCWQYRRRLCRPIHEFVTGLFVALLSQRDIKIGAISKAKCTRIVTMFAGICLWRYFD